MNHQNDLEARVVELEIQLALQEDLIDSLNLTIVQMQQTLELQQAQLRLLYQRIQDKRAEETPQGYTLSEEIPPHY